RAFEHEFEQARRGKAFYVRNDIVWTAMLDSRDMLFIRVTGWAKRMYRQGGFWGTIQANHLKQLFVKLPSSTLSSDEVTVGRSRRNSFERLFPEAATRGSLCPSDVDSLKKRFVEALKPIVADRDSHRAHPYEKAASVDNAMLGL